MTDVCTRESQRSDRAATSERLFVIAARNGLRTLAEIVTLLAHRKADVVSIEYAADAPGNLVRVSVIVRISSIDQAALLYDRLNRIVDVIDIVPAITR